MGPEEFLSARFANRNGNDDAPDVLPIAKTLTDPQTPGVKGIWSSLLLILAVVTGTVFHRLNAPVVLLEPFGRTIFPNRLRRRHALGGESEL